MRLLSLQKEGETPELNPSTHLREHREGSHLQVRRRGLIIWTEFAGTLILDFPTSRNMRSKHLLFKPLGLWYFILAAQPG